MITPPSSNNDQVLRGRSQTCPNANCHHNAASHQKRKKNKKIAFNGRLVERENPIGHQSIRRPRLARRKCSFPRFSAPALPPSPASPQTTLLLAGGCIDGTFPPGGNPTHRLCIQRGGKQRKANQKKVEADIVLTHRGLTSSPPQQRVCTGWPEVAWQHRKYRMANMRAAS